MSTIPENTDERIREIHNRYEDLFQRQPNYRWTEVPTYLLPDENGGYAEVRGIIVWVTKKVDQSEIPAEDRIPDCLEGVPVQIVEEDIRLLGGSQ